MDREEFEAEYEGRPVDKVFEMPPDDKCNARRTDSNNRFVAYCRATAGRGTDHVGSGRCKHHGGCSSGPVDTTNTAGNAEKHGLKSDPRDYTKRLSDEEGEWVRDMSAIIMDRLRSMREVDGLDRVLARRVAIKLHIAAQASEYIAEQGMIEQIWTADGQIEVRNRVMDELRRYDNEIISELETLGLLNDPETKKADALSEWKSFIQ